VFHDRKSRRIIDDVADEIDQFGAYDDFDEGGLRSCRHRLTQSINLIARHCPLDGYRCEHDFIGAGNDRRGEAYDVSEIIDADYRRELLQRAPVGGEHGVGGERVGVASWRAQERREHKEGCEPRRKTAES